MSNGQARDEFLGKYAWTPEPGLYDPVKAEALHLLQLAIPAGCPIGMRALLRSKKDRRKMQAVRLPCLTWRCGPCSNRLRRRAGVSYGSFLLKEDRPLNVLHLLPKEWTPTYYMRLHRGNKSWVRVLAPDGGSTLIGAELVEGSISPGPIAVSQLGAALRKIKAPSNKGRYCPIASSKDWAMPPAPEAQWDLIQSLRTKDPNLLMAMLNAAGLNCCAKSSPIAGCWTVVWFYPPNWSQEQIDSVNFTISQRNSDVRTSL